MTRSSPMVVRRVLFAGVVALAAIGASAPAAFSETETETATSGDAAAALAILDKYCSNCHGGPAAGARADKGGFGHVLDPQRMAAEGQLERFAPDRSELFERIAGGEMPPGKRPRPSAEEIAVLRSWIEGGARAPGPSSSRQSRSNLSPDDVAAAIWKDLRAAPSKRARRSWRYVSIAHLYNAGRSDEELELARDAIAKLVASLTWTTTLSAPVAVDPQRTVFRLELIELGWNTATWDEIVKADPYAGARKDATNRKIRRATRTLVPTVSGDWLVSAAAKPPLYHQILDLPEDLSRLERRLGVVRTARIRAGFNGSGVSRHNRVIERSDRGDGGYYWRSYDFDGSEGPRNIFESPLSFSYDGGEVIFSLPNGMQAYLLVDASGRRIDRAPTTIVTDPSRSDSTVENGVSCMGCHGLGLIEKRDEVRAHLLANRRAFDRATVRSALQIYAESSLLSARLDEDRSRFEAALAVLGVDTAVEPIDAMSRLFEGELTAGDVAAELGIGVDRLARALRTRSGLRRQLGALLVDGGTVKRDVFSSAFPEAARAVGDIEPLVDADRATRLLLRCDTFSGRACYEAGNLYFHGRGVVRKRRFAATLYRRACDSSYADGCNAEAFVTAAGKGVARNRTTALKLYRRACRLGSARGCHNQGLRVLSGVGTTADPSRGVALLERACRGGRARACDVAGNELFGGARVRRNRARAALLFGEACDGGIGNACRKLGDQHLFGRGASLDWLKANRAYRKGCALGNKRSCAGAGRVFDLLEP